MKEVLGFLERSCAWSKIAGNSKDVDGRRAEPRHRNSESVPLRLKCGPIMSITERTPDGVAGRLRELCAREWFRGPSRKRSAIAPNAISFFSWQPRKEAVQSRAGICLRSWTDDWPPGAGDAGNLPQVGRELDLLEAAAGEQFGDRRRLAKADFENQEAAGSE